MEKLFKSKGLKLSDQENNTLDLLNAYIDLEKNEILGSDFNLIFDKNLFSNPENDPRLKGRYILTNKDETIMKKSTFTTCKNIKGKCPVWSISAEEVNHKKEKKRIEYKNAWLEVYECLLHIFLIFHPDPTVKDNLVFLFQFINTQNLAFQQRSLLFSN